MGKSKRKAAPGAKTGAAQMKKLQTQFSENSAYSQRLRLLAEIEVRQSVTTIEARRDLDILMPAARVFELRALGHDIATVWTQGETECGRKHRIARYVLRKAAP